MTRNEDVARRAASWLLWLYPARFRARHGPELEEALLRWSRDPRYPSTPAGRCRLLFDVWLDVTRSSLDVWSQELWSPAPVLIAVPSPGGIPMTATLTHPPATAHARFKEGFSETLWTSILAATVLHFAVLNYFPELHAKDITRPMSTIAVVPPVEVPLPKPPEDLVRPGAPVIAADATEVTLTLPDASTLWESSPNLPPPPSQASDPDAHYSLLTPSMVAPAIKNRDEVARALEREYPELLRIAGIGGVVQVQFLLNETGGIDEVSVQRSSGHSALDDAALKVARIARFTPALNRDQAVPVMVTFPIRFEVRR